MATTQRAYVASSVFMVLCKVVSVQIGHTSGDSLFHGLKLVFSGCLVQHPLFDPSVMSTSSFGIWGVYPRAGTQKKCVSLFLFKNPRLMFFAKQPFTVFCVSLENNKKTTCIKGAEENYCFFRESSSLFFVTVFSM